MGMDYFYRATVQWTNKGKVGEERIPIYSFGDPRGGWTFYWPSFTLDHLKLLIDRVNTGKKLQICTDAYLSNRAFPGTDIPIFTLNIHDSTDRESAPTEERKVIATIRGYRMEVKKKEPVNRVPRMTCERFDSEKPMQVNGSFVGVTLGLFENLSFQRR